MSGMFWASLAGARADENASLITNRNRWVEYARELEGRVNSLERNVSQLQEWLGQWQDSTAERDAHVVVALNAFKEVTGKSVREHFGDEETDRRVAKEMVLSRRHYGLK